MDILRTPLSFRSGQDIHCRLGQLKCSSAVPGLMSGVTSATTASPPWSCSAMPYVRHQMVPELTLDHAGSSCVWQMLASLGTGSPIPVLSKMVSPIWERKRRGGRVSDQWRYLLQTSCCNVQCRKEVFARS